MKETPDKDNKAAKMLRLRCRPLWQRFAYPLVGIILIGLGLLLWMLPIVPGFPLIIIGLPLLFCFHPRVELRMRQLLQKFGRYIMKKIRKTSTKN